MDICDEAQGRTEHFQKMSLANRIFDAAPLPPEKMDKNCNALCMLCDADITARRRVVTNAQRCIECQTDFEKMERR